MLKKNLSSTRKMDGQQKKVSLDGLDHISCFISLLKLVKQFPIHLGINERYLVIRTDNISEYMVELIIRLICAINGTSLTFYHSELENGWIYDFSIYADEIKSLDELYLSGLDSRRYNQLKN